MMCQRQFPCQAINQALTCPLRILHLHRCTSQCLLALVGSMTTSLLSPKKLLRIKNTTASNSNKHKRHKLRSIRSIRTSRSTISRNTTNRNTATTRNTTNKRITRVLKKAAHQPHLENLPLLETQLPLEMTMTAGRQAKIDLRCFGNLGRRDQSGHSDKKYARFWLMRTDRLFQ